MIGFVSLQQVSTTRLAEMVCPERLLLGGETALAPQKEARLGARSIVFQGTETGQARAANSDVAKLERTDAELKWGILTRE